jgi:hypothetical protein
MEGAVSKEKPAEVAGDAVTHVVVAGEVGIAADFEHTLAGEVAGAVAVAVDMEVAEGLREECADGLLVSDEGVGLAAEDVVHEGDLGDGDGGGVGGACGRRRGGIFVELGVEGSIADDEGVAGGVEDFDGDAIRGDVDGDEVAGLSEGGEVEGVREEMTCQFEAAFEEVLRGGVERGVKAELLEDVMPAGVKVGEDLVELAAGDSERPLLFVGVQSRVPSPDKFGGLGVVLDGEMSCRLHSWPPFD